MLSFLYADRAAKDAFSSAAKFKYADILKIISTDLFFWILGEADNEIYVWLFTEFIVYQSVYKDIYLDNHLFSHFI